MQLESTEVAAVGHAAVVVDAVVAADVVVVDVAVAVDDSDFAGTFSNFIFSDLQSLEEFGRLRRQYPVTRERATRHDQIQHKSYLDTRHHRSRVFRELCLAMDSR